MTFITKTLRQFLPEELELLKVRPPTDESRELASTIGKMMGQEAYPGDMVRQSVDYVGMENNWPAEIANLIGKLAYDGMQQGYSQLLLEDLRKDY